MMQMLAAGGMSILTDGKRTADEDNPRGYLEWEAAKQLPQKPNLIAEAEGKAVKVISQLLLALPNTYQYHVIFMKRPLPEVVKSQSEMIRRRGSTGAAVAPEQLIALFQTHLTQVTNWMKSNANVKFCPVSHHDLLSTPAAVCATVQQFLGLPLDTTAMAAQVDSSLYRQRQT